jgi:hypothetical protein
MVADEMAERIAQAQELTRRMFAVLAGQPPECIGAALVDCVATFVACHHNSGAEHMETLLQLHVESVRKILAARIKDLQETRGELNG